MLTENEKDECDLLELGSYDDHAFHEALSALDEDLDRTMRALRSLHRKGFVCFHKVSNRQYALLSAEEVNYLLEQLDSGCFNLENGNDAFYSFVNTEAGDAFFNSDAAVREYIENEWTIKYVTGRRHGQDLAT